MVSRSATLGCARTRIYPTNIAPSGVLALRRTASLSKKEKDEARHQDLDRRSERAWLSSNCVIQRAGTPC